MLALNGGGPLRNTPFPAWPVYGPGEEEALLAVLHSGRWFLDAHIQLFEREFAAFQQAKFGIATSNGTTALQVALDAIGIRPGDEIIVPAYTFIATASAVCATGGIPVFADIDPASYNIDPQSVENAITEKTRAVIGVHIAGRPCDLDALGALAARHQIHLLEDAAQAHAAGLERSPRWGHRPFGHLQLPGQQKPLRRRGRIYHHRRRSARRSRLVGTQLWPIAYGRLVRAPIGRLQLSHIRISRRPAPQPA
jgi:hypothetical protein